MKSLNLSTYEIIIISIVIMIVFFLIRWVISNIRVANFLHFYKKYELQNYKDTFFEMRLTNIIDADSTPDVDKLKALKLLKRYYEDQASSGATKMVHDFINKYKLNTNDDKITIIKLLKEISNNIDNPQDDRDFANRRINDLEQNTNLKKR